MNLTILHQTVYHFRVCLFLPFHPFSFELLKVVVNCLLDFLLSSQSFPSQLISIHPQLLGLFLVKELGVSDCMKKNYDQKYLSLHLSGN